MERFRLPDALRWGTVLARAPAVQQAVETAIARHPEIQGMMQNLRAAEAGVSVVARSGYLPSLSASISYNRGGEELSCPL